MRRGGDTSSSITEPASATSYGTLKYCYDAESRLTSILSAGTCSSPTTIVATYAWDAQGRRKSKTVGTTTTLYVTDADNREIVEYNGSSGAVGNWYAYGRGANDVLGQMNGAGTDRKTLIPDIQGSFIGSLDSGGTLAKAAYLSYGENPSSTSGTFRYTGQRIDPETGGSASQPSALYYYRARMYSPTWGRFLQADPAGYGAGNNLYAYVGNDPLDLTDPFGLAADSPGGGLWNGFKDYLQGSLEGLAQIPSAIANDIQNPSQGLHDIGELAMAVPVGAGIGAEVKEVTTAAEGISAEFSAIGSTRQVGEQWLANNLGGTSQAYFSTSQGARYVDQFANGVANESKVGYTSLTSSVQTQISKDVELMQTQQVQGVNWHFFDSPVTGRGGPSQPLSNALQQNNINIILHPR